MFSVNCVTSHSVERWPWSHIWVFSLSLTSNIQGSISKSFLFYPKSHLLSSIPFLIIPATTTKLKPTSLSTWTTVTFSNWSAHSLLTSYKIHSSSWKLNPNTSSTVQWLFITFEIKSQLYTATKGLSPLFSALTAYQNYLILQNYLRNF